MNDKVSPGTSKSDATPSPTGDGQAGFSVNFQYVKDLSFENPFAPDSLVGQKESPDVGVQVNVAARPLAGDHYEIELKILAKAEANESTIFIAEVTYAGVFTLNNIPEEHVQPLLLIECPRFLFPFARAILADVTRDGGFPPLMIQPVDFLALYN
ncbi:MAG: protein-export chaperone SecB, partial [Alphaproteobacteria bacterium]|nr:protein-export chaperone SecB [Alphaproteobacteria bacterium]